MFETIIKGGRVIDPATGDDDVADIAVNRGKIVAIDKNLSARQAKKVVNAKGHLVLPGLIDTHGHIFEHVSGEFGLNPDAVGVYSGVTTVCDQGGPSPLTVGGFRKFIAEPAKTDVRCFLSSYLAGGLYGHKYVDLYGPVGIDIGAIEQSYAEQCCPHRTFMETRGITTQHRHGLGIRQVRRGRRRLQKR